MDCCESNDDKEMLDTHNDDNDSNAVDKKQCGCGCGGTSGCGIKMFIVMAIVVAVIWYLTRS